MKIVICEDEPRYQSALAEAIGRWQSACGHTDIELSVFPSSEDLLETLDRGMEIDLLFIDIEIPGEMNGVELARRIRGAQLDMTIVFCTNYSEYVYDGYTVNALRYLQKPAAQQDVDFCCSYVYNRLPIRSQNALTIVSGGRRHVLRHIEIRCIEAQLRTLLISTTLSAEPLRVSARLSDIRDRLPASLFALCHRSYIVNIAHVRMITRTACILSDGSSVPVSRTYANAVAEAFDRYHQGGRTPHDLSDI